MTEKWEVIIPVDDDRVYHRRLYRCPVPGGWLYKSGNHSDGLCFVPDPGHGLVARPDAIDAEFTIIERTS